MGTRIYLAAPLFSEAERKFNRQVRDLLAERSCEVYLPQESGEPEPHDGEGGGDRIFRLHLDALRAADAVVAIADGPDTDSGTAWEMGYAYALGIPVIALRTDRRRAAGGRILNLMLACSSSIAMSVEELIPLLERALGKKS